MEIETVTFCPLGKTCEEIKDGKIHRCRWYLKMSKSDGRGNQIPGSEWDECAISLQSLHLTEMKKGQLGVQQAVESRGNEQIKRADAFLELAYGARNDALISSE